MRNRNLERELDDTTDRMRERMWSHARDTADTAGGLVERGRLATRQLGRSSRDYGRQLSHMAEDVADEAQYQYRRARRHAGRHPIAATAIVAGTVGAFLVLRRLLRSDD